MTAKELRALREQRSTAVAAARALVTAAESEDRALTAEEQTAYDGHRNQITALDARIERLEAVLDDERAQAGTGRAATGHDMREDDPRRGFADYGDFAAAVRAASMPGAGVRDERLLIGAAAPASYGATSPGADGGYLIPPEFSGRIAQHMLEEDSLLALCDNLPVSGNSMTMPRDETTPWGSTGIRAYWEAEAAQATPTKPVIGTNTMRLHKLFALVPVTEELASDAPALSAYLERKTGESIRYKVNAALVRGTGAGQPKGILTAGCLVTQAKKSGQAADTIVADNVAAMYARCLRPGSAVWLVNPDAWHQLPLMTIGDQPVWIGPQGVQATPGGTLMGRPVIMTETCATLGDAGDIIFADMSSYVAITKAAGITTATSMHLWFDYDIMAFRATFRIDGQPAFEAAVTPPNSSVTRSPFVTLAART